MLVALVINAATNKQGNIISKNIHSSENVWKFFSLFWGEMNRLEVRSILNAYLMIIRRLLTQSL